MRSLLLWFLIVSPGWTAEPQFDQQPLFESGKGGYAMYRIPGMVITRKGTLLVYCEARQSGNDWGQIDLLYRRSIDAGKTWSKPQKLPEIPGEKRKNPVALKRKLAKSTEITTNNPVMIADHDGTVHLLLCLEYQRCFYCKSSDDGESFSQPVEITDTFKEFQKQYDWKVIATGPGHGIQLKSGRLVVPVWLSLGTGGNAHRPSVTASIYSDDAGKTWKAGDIAVPDTGEWSNPNETCCVELSDGRVLFNVRSQSKSNRRLLLTSPDGATKWSRPEFHEQLKEPICFASMERWIDPKSQKINILFANPDTLEVTPPRKATPGSSRDRKNLTIQLSEDDGKTWKIRRVLEPGFSGYSDLATTADGMIYCFYERGSSDGKSSTRIATLTLAKFNRAWLESAK